jgi:hypothetical protein
LKSTNGANTLVKMVVFLYVITAKCIGIAEIHICPPLDNLGV